MVESLEVRAMLSAAVTKAPVVKPLLDALTIDGGGMTPGGAGHAGSDYQTSGRWFSTATNASTGSNGSPITLTWSIVDDGLMIPGYNNEADATSNLRAKLNSLYGSQSVWLPLFQSVFDSWSAKTGVTYVYQPTDDGVGFGTANGQLSVRGDIRIGGHNVDGPFGVLAYNFFPGDDNGGDMVIDTSEFNTATASTNAGVFRYYPTNQLAFRNTIAHEFGHGLGLDHVIPLDNTKLLEPNLSLAFDGPQFDDVLAVQSLYGDALEKGTRNETAATATNLGTLPTANNQSLATNVSVFTGDLDNFKFTLSSDRSVSFTASPVGGTYLEGPQDGSATSFNAAAQANLAINIYASNGTTLIASSNVNGIGAAETVSASLAAGTYIVRVAGTGSAQMYALTGSVVISGSAPSAPDLTVASDAGDSSTDNITNVNTPTFTGTSLGLATISLFADGNLVGTSTAAADGTWSVTSSALSDGAHVITASANSSGVISPTSPGTNITIDTVGIAVGAKSYDFEVTQDVSITLGEAFASKLSADEVILTNTSTSTTLPAATVIVSGAGKVATIGFDGNLPDGRYVLTIPTGAVTDVAGNGLIAPATLSFDQLAGDADRGGTVDFFDLVALAQNYNSVGKTFSQGNFDYDPAGRVDFSDLVIIAQHYNMSLPPAFSALQLTPPTTLTPPLSATTKKKVAKDVLS